MQYQGTGHSVMSEEWCGTAQIILKLFHLQVYFLCCADGTQRISSPEERLCRGLQTRLNSLIILGVPRLFAGGISAAVLGAGV